MSYEKYTWQTGEVITAEKLNHMEDGIEAAGSGGGLNILPIVDGKVTCTVSDVTAGTLFAFDMGDGQYSINAVMNKTYNDRTGSTEVTTIGADAGGAAATVWTYNTSEGAFIPNE